MPETPLLSPAMQCLTLLWQHQSRRLTQRQQAEGMRQGLDLVLRIGLSFGLEDFVWLSTTRGEASYHPSPCGFLVWCTEGYQETIYRAACQARHTSACLAYEHWRHRAPFFWQGSRLYVGAGLDWEGQRILVTSFHDQAGTLTACGYTQFTRYWTAQNIAMQQGDGKTTHRVTLTPAQLRAAQQATPAVAAKEEV